jgi:hypothetical protein
MSEPLEYYTSYSRSKLIKYIQEKYGSRLEGISIREKFYLIQELSRDLSLRVNDRNAEIRAEIHWLQYDLIKELSPSDKEGMIEALITQVRLLR